MSLVNRVKFINLKRDKGEDSTNMKILLSQTINEAIDNGVLFDIKDPQDITDIFDIAAQKGYAIEPENLKKFTKEVIEKYSYDDLFKTYLPHISCVNADDLESCVCVLDTIKNIPIFDKFKANIKIVDLKEFEQRIEKIEEKVSGGNKVQPPKAPEIDLNLVKQVGQEVENTNVEQVTQILNEHPELIDYYDKDNYPLLIRAVYVGSTEMIELLVKLGANPSIVDSKKETPIFQSMKRGNTECLKKLIDLGADIRFKGNNKSSYLHMIATLNKLKEDKRLEIAQILIDAGCSKNAKNINGKTPAEICKVSKLKVLLKP